MSLLDLVTQQLGGNGIRQLSHQIGADEQQTAGAVQMALPVLLGGLAKNAQSPAGAQALGAALDKDHDPGLLDNLGAMLGGGGAAGGGLGGALSGAMGGAGAGILGHILGGRQPAVEQGLGKATGLNSGQVGKLLMLLAPIVMAALARQKQQRGVDAGDLGGMLATERDDLQRRDPKLGGLASMLDRDGDGSIVDDLGKLAGGGGAGGLGGMLGGLLGGR
jgi:hypothetical protein